MKSMNNAKREGAGGSGSSSVENKNPEDPEMFTCSFCGASFATPDRLHAHMVEKHPVQRYLQDVASSVDSGFLAVARAYDPKGVIAAVTPDKATVDYLLADIAKAHPKEKEAVEPFTPAKVYAEKKKRAEDVEGWARGRVVAEGLLANIPFVDADVVVSGYEGTPTISADMQQATSVFLSRYQFGQAPYIQRYWQQIYTPFLPGYADMISVYMREGYMAEKWVEIPQEFVNFIRELGFSEFWAYRLWGKHWVLPGVSHLYEMFHKKIIDYNTMAGMLKYHDFEPVWRARLIENAYQMIPRVDLRRGYVWGLISEAELQERYEKLGYGPGDAAIMKNIAKRFGLSAYYSRLLTVACQAFRRGQLEGPAFQEILEDVGLPEDAQDLILEAEMLAREIGAVEPGEEPRTLTASQVCATYTKGFLSLSAAKKRLLDLGYLEDDADLLLALATPKPEAEAPATEIVSAASLLYREGWMDPAEYAGWLRKARLSEEEIAVVKDAQDLRYRLDYARELLALSKEEYRKDIITLDEFYMYLLRFGCQPERAAAIVALEEARKIPKPKLGA